MGNATVDSLIFNGSIAGQVSLQSQPLGGNLIFQLPNVPPTLGQLISTVAVNSTTIVLGWANAQSGVGSVFGRTGAVAAASNDYNFNQLAGTLAIAQINSKQGNGNAVQLTNTGATVTGDVATYDANSNVVDSGTLLSSLAPKAAPSFTGAVTITNTSGSAISLTVQGNSTGDVVRFEKTNAAAAVQVISTGDLFVRNHVITDNASVSGTTTITSSTTHAVSYDVAFTGTSAPIVVVVPVGADPTAIGAYWITNQGSANNWTGFTVNIKNSGSAVFNYHVIGS